MVLPSASSRLLVSSIGWICESHLILGSRSSRVKEMPTLGSRLMSSQQGFRFPNEKSSILSRFDDVSSRLIGGTSIGVDVQRYP